MLFRAAVFFVSCASLATAEPLRIVSWNVESGGNDPAVIAEQLVELGRYDIVALQEVHSRNIGRYGNAIRDGISKSYRYFASNTGRSDRLMIIFDSDRLQMTQSCELFEHEGHRLNDWLHRSPLVAHFKDRQTGEMFLFLTVHLARGDAKLRTEQARGLREWARDQTLPIVAAGDFNMDFDFPTQKGNEAFDEFLAGDVWQWVKPAELIDTNWSDSDGDGMDDYPDSMLDFCFVVGTAKDWTSDCRVIVRDGDFPDDARTADHRPVELTVTP